MRLRTAPYCVRAAAVAKSNCATGWIVKPSGPVPPTNELNVAGVPSVRFCRAPAAAAVLHSGS